MSIHKYLTSIFPLGIVINIYEYDPTYRIFKNKEFNIEIINYKDRKKIRYYFDELFSDRCVWTTHYGKFSHYKEDVNINDTWLGITYNILLNRYNNYVLFAIVPQNIYDTLLYDGFLCSYSNIGKVPNDIKNKYKLPIYFFNGLLFNDQTLMYIR
jgi:hypothetical protein